MLTDKTNQLFLATKVGAYAQAVEAATRSDGRARGDVKSNDRAPEAVPPQVRGVALWRGWRWRAWIMFVVLLAIAVGVALVSD